MLYHNTYMCYGNVYVNVNVHVQYMCKYTYILSNYNAAMVINA